MKIMNNGKCEQCEQVKEEVLHLQTQKTEYHFCTGCLEKYFQGLIVFD
ncbi:hypothetical protein M5W68_18425 [Paenibacillus larvae]|nr:hypothetical protein [Paenibacillus larvae]MCY9512330.1 hypothetical protein [Paenibacillus larvae]MCY9527028.1 hypothetical protein [Paenibacillus larvae]